ncbi:hypothetical protein KIPB_016661, partial [Kipferlia bialata]
KRRVAAVNQKVPLNTPDVQAACRLIGKRREEYGPEKELSILLPPVEGDGAGFMWIYCTRWMAQMARASLEVKPVIHLDATHGTNRYGFHLYHVVAQAPCGMGVVVGEFVIEHDRGVNVQFCLERLSAYWGGVTPEYLVIDDSAVEKLGIPLAFPGAK